MRLAVREGLLHPGPATPQYCRDCGEEIKPEVDRGWRAETAGRGGSRPPRGLVIL